MINRVYKLVAPGQFIAKDEERQICGEGIIVKPTSLSICAADQRYYTGNRPECVIKKKLPMALIHEGVGTVIYDPHRNFKSGDKVVMIPNTPVDNDEIIGENYLQNSKFRSSGYDGFTQEYIFLHKDRVIKYDNIDDDIAAFIELISVAMHAINRFERKSNIRKDTIGVWGDGSLGFIIALILKHKYSESKIIVFGKNDIKLNFFSFVDCVHKIDEIPSGLKVDHAFEVVGGNASNIAINQIIDYINPEGTIMLLGVSEANVRINTRMILEKGLTLIGNSRSSIDDFYEAISFLKDNKDYQHQFRKIISKIIEINNVEDLKKSFEYDLSTSFKTILKWNL